MIHPGHAFGTTKDARMRESDMNREEAERQALMEQVYLPMREGGLERGRQDRLRRSEDETARAGGPCEGLDDEYESVERDRAFRHKEYMKGICGHGGDE